jgi:hypothetical protein
MPLIRLVLPVLSLLWIGCEHADPLGADGGLSPTLSSIQQDIFNTSCALSGCHRGPDAQMGLDLSAGNAFANLVNVASRERPELLRVRPGQPDESYLIMKVEGTAGIVGARMPLGAPPLSADRISALRRWIAEGAKND